MVVAKLKATRTEIVTITELWIASAESVAKKAELAVTITERTAALEELIVEATTKQDDDKISNYLALDIYRDSSKERINSGNDWINSEKDKINSKKDKKGQK